MHLFLVNNSTGFIFQNPLKVYLYGIGSIWLRLCVIFLFLKNDNKKFACINEDTFLKYRLALGLPLFSKDNHFSVSILLQNKRIKIQTGHL
jgi:hypothetical protein